jgi:hypothetical protein
MQTVGRAFRASGHLLRACLSFVISATTHPALAEGSAAEQASKLFDDGLQFMQSDHCQDAVPLFAESQRLDPAAATLANLATCYVRLGKTGSAYETYRAAARAAILENKPELQKKADKAAAGLAPSLTRLRVVPMDGSELPEIRINGQRVEDVRHPVPLDPGENLIEAMVPGQAPWRRTVSAQGEGTLLVVEVPDLSARRDESKPEVLRPQSGKVPIASDAPGQIDLKRYVIVAASVGTVSLALGTGFALAARSKQNDSDAYCEGRQCTDPGIALRDQARDRAAVANWMVGIGVASLGTAGVLWILSNRRDQPSRTAKVIPWVTIDRPSAGIALRGNL